MSIFVVIFVANILVKTILLKKEKEFGIKKAVGFTSAQIRTQLALFLVWVAVPASIAGAVCGVSDHGSDDYFGGTCKLFPVP